MSAFGREQVIAAASRDPPRIENEVELAAQLRLKLGPHADDQRVLYHVRASGGKLHWAVNSYFRDTFNAPPRDHFDFQASSVLVCPPKAAQQQAQAQAGAQADAGTGAPPGAASSSHLGSAASSAAASAEASAAADPAHGADCSPRGSGSGAGAEGAAEDTSADGASAAPAGASCGSLDALPVAILEEVLRHLDAWSLCSAARTSVAFARAAQADRIWEGLFAAEWGGVVFPTDTGLAVAAAGAGAAGGVAQQQQQPADGVDGAAPASTSSPAAEAAPPRSSSPAAASTSAASEAAGGASGSAAPQPPGAPSGYGRGRWQSLYRRQAQAVWQMACPRCGTSASVVPVVYGFPSPRLLQGMKSRRLILGGDHLIENCHAWACTTCNSSFRTYPFTHVLVWVEELASEALRGQRGGQPPPNTRALHTYEL
ncbi:hypothetical protein FOA52_001304 [Chlamydomonas sp. UWO 241]|nr:hypothetical protein FOA52_001304 [Chlamydomonas sp. UWO 241]